VLRSLRIENFVLIRGADLVFGPRLNAVTGETGAGKTILAQAIGLLLGAPGDAGYLGPGASEAYVEADFDLPQGILDDEELATLAELRPEEETGLADLALEPGIYDLDRHLIPARKQDPEHWHYDVRFVVRAGEDEAFVVSEESHALAWRPVREIADDPAIDESVRRLARKWLARKS